jgi:UDP-3-O-[3-hydroxymyristoyl] N-acetylglucosamine deacetylase
VSIGTVEHVLSAAAGEGLDNCLIEIEGPEVPILDGSALPFVPLPRGRLRETAGARQPADAGAPSRSPAATAASLTSPTDPG